MLKNITQKITKIITDTTRSHSSQQLMLGRWRLKHESSVCERYIENYYGEPGYPNKFKQEWINQKQNTKY